MIEDEIVLIKPPEFEYLASCGDFGSVSDSPFLQYLLSKASCIILHYIENNQLKMSAFFIISGFLQERKFKFESAHFIINNNFKNKNSWEKK